VRVRIKSSIQPLRMLNVFLPLVVLLVMSASSYAVDEIVTAAQNEPPTDTRPLSDFVFADESIANAKNSSSSKTFPDIWCGKIDDEITMASCWKAYRNSFDYFKVGLSHRERVLKWQHFSTRVILVVVLLLVSVGLYFAWAQFHTGMNTRNETSTELELSSKGLKISSPVLGVIILVISLAFFYLYLIFVYPIKELI